MCQDTPDTSKSDATADKLAGLSESQFNWVKTEYDKAAPDRAAATERANVVSDAQLDLMKTTTGLMKEGAADYRNIYKPIEAAAAQDAVTYNSEAKREEAAGRAGTDVQTAYAGARDITERNAASMGINVSDPAFLAAQAQMQPGMALAQVDAMGTARDKVEATGRALRSDVINTGRGVATGAGANTSLALTAGNGAVGSAVVPTQVAAGGVGMMNSGYDAASRGLTGAANIYTSNANAKAGADAGNGAAIGGLASSAAMAFAV